METTTTPVSRTGKKMALVTPEGTVVEDSCREGEWVKEPGENDVLCGRGGSINSHPGNERFRELVEKRKRVYLTARFKREKRLIASSVVSEIRNQNPPGRFLSRDGRSGLWRDIGDEKARDKTSQALRENAPSIRAEIETEINQQRAEMQRAEEEEAARVTAPPHGHPYYQHGWGYYYPPYYGYGHQQLGPPPCPPPPPRPAHSYPSEPYEGQWSDDAPQGNAHQHRQGESHAPVPQYGYDKQDPYPSAFEQTANFVSSVPSSIAAWTKASISFGGHSHSSSSDTQDAHDVPKPIVYVHQPEPSADHVASGAEHHTGPHRRVVHFQDDRYAHRSRHNNHQHYHQQQQQHHVHERSQGSDTPVMSNHSQHTRNFNNNNRDRLAYSPILSKNSIVDEEPAEDAKPPARDIQPQSPVESEERNSSLLTQVANQILGSLGSWDTNIICAHDSSDDHVPFPQSSHPPAAMPPRHTSDIGETEHPTTKCPPQSSRDQELPGAAMEYEGQEVQLMEKMDCEDDGGDVAMKEDDVRMPPPAAPVDWPSRVGSCHSWIPDTLGAASFFSASRGSNPVSPANSMDASAAEAFSCAGSVGGASLCQVFDKDVIAEGLPSPMASQMDHKVLSQMPSWERTFLCKSPLSIDSEDESLISKVASDDKSIPGNGSPKGNVMHSSPTNMAWENQTRE